MSGVDGKKKALLAGVVSVALFLGIGGLIYVFPSASNQGYAPEQPIPFSHKQHAGENKIACQYCHSSVEVSSHANIPSLNVCMNCHRVVKTGSPWIQQITKLYNEGKPVEWVRIHELPDHAHFPHKRHVAAGVSCETCHGDVKKMERVYQYAPLDMGWCLDCHRGKTTPRSVVAKLFPGEKNYKGQVASINCNACHY